MYLTIALISIGLAMDALAVSLGIGTAGEIPTLRGKIRLAAHFGIFQAGMTALGWLAGETIVGYVAGFDHWIAFALLGYVGTNLIRAGLSNGGKAFEPAIIPLTRRVIVMGGSFNIQNPAPEFNARCDPEAAHIVFSSGWDVHILGLDITRRVHFSRGDFASLPDGSPAVELLKKQAPGWIDRMEEMGWEQDGCALHDAVAVAYLVDPTIFDTRESGVEIELADPNLRGVTRFSPTGPGRPGVKVLTGLDSVKCRDIIWSHLQQ